MRVFVSIACAVAVIGVVDVAAAQSKSGPKVKTTAGAAAMKSTGSAAHGKSVTAKPVAAPKSTGSTKTTKAGTSAHGGGNAHATETKATGRAKSSTGTTKTASTTTAASTTTVSTGVSTTGVPLTPVQQKLQRNTNLSSKLQSRLPGMDLNTAAAGFRNLGQFVAAVNVSKNLGLDFTTLKTAMVTDGKSLGQAIQSQKGTSVDAPREAQRAEHDAETMIRVTEKDSAEKSATEKTTTEKSATEKASTEKGSTEKKASTGKKVKSTGHPRQ
jgi:hypothetical protein